MIISSKCHLFLGLCSVVNICHKKMDTRSQWLASIKERRGFNKACVALANKNARILWALMAHKQDYRMAQ